MTAENRIPSLAMPKEIISNKHFNRPFCAVLGLFILFSVIAWNNTCIPFNCYDEKEHAECAREMLETKNFIIPVLNYEMRVEKPPLIHYGMILIYTLFGVNEFSSGVRIPICFF